MNIQQLMQQAAEACQAARWQQAEKLYRQVLQQQPEHPEALFLLGALACQLGHYQAALPLLVKASQVNPGNAQCFYNIGNACKALGRLNEAGRAFQQAVRIKPDFAEAYNDLGVTCRRLQRLDDAIRCYQQAIHINPRYTDAWYNLGIAQHERGDTEAAIAALQQGLDLQPGDGAISNNLGNLYEQCGRYEEAIACYRQATRQADIRPTAYFNLGNVFTARGQINEAQKAYRKSLSLNPAQAEVHYALARVKKFGKDDPQHRAMEKLRDDEKLQGEQRSLLHFALAKAYEDCEEYDQAFACLRIANDIKRATYRYDPDEDKQLMENIARWFDAPFFAARRQWGEPCARPIFILGMPRSGTTLIEQILSSHPQVCAGGELKALRLSLFTSEPGFSARDFPHAADTLSEATVHRLAHDYLKRTAHLRTTADRLGTDKMPANFLYIGMIRLLFPNARVIHCRRDPVDTCLSCYKHYFIGHQPFAYDLTELGHYYRHYQALMKHWHDVLPGFVLDVQYEDLVEDQESQTRRVLAHCGLPWDASCLSFHESRRSVTTNSNIQVRQALYHDAVRRWKHYENHLGSLLEALRAPATLASRPDHHD